MAAPFLLLRSGDRPRQNTEPDKRREAFLHCLYGILGRNEDEKSGILIFLLFCIWETKSILGINGKKYSDAEWMN